MRFLEVFKSSYFADVSLDQWMAVRTAERVSASGDIAIWSCWPMTAIAGKTPQERTNLTESERQISSVW